MSAPDAMISAFIVTCDKQPEEILHAVVKRISWADQIILIDKGRKRVSSFPESMAGYDYIRLPWSPVVEPDRVVAVAHCAHPWIVMLDDDEILSPDCERIFRQAAESDEIDVLEIPVRHHVLGRFDRAAFYWPEWRPTLHRLGSITFHSTLHRGVEVNGGTRVMKLHEESPAYIDHLSHANVSQWFEKTNRYTDYPKRKSAGRAETDYVSAVAWLRKEYDMIDALKRWEAENLPDGVEAFRQIAQEVLRG